MRPKRVFNKILNSTLSNIFSVWEDGNCGGGIHIFIDQSGYVIVNIILQIE